MVLFYKDSKKIDEVVVAPKSKTPLFECTIKELSQRIATENVDESVLLKVIEYVAKECVFPSKQGEENADKHLKFVHEFCLNKNAKGSTIAKMSNTLKAINSTYKKEIDAQEKVGVANRDKKEKDV